jgi:hypothetical protein
MVQAKAPGVRARAGGVQGSEWSCHRRTKGVGPGTGTGFCPAPKPVGVTQGGLHSTNDHQQSGRIFASSASKSAAATFRCLMKRRCFAVFGGCLFTRSTGSGQLSTDDSDCHRYFYVFCSSVKFVAGGEAGGKHPETGPSVTICRAVSGGFPFGCFPSGGFAVLLPLEQPLLRQGHWPGGQPPAGQPPGGAVRRAVLGERSRGSGPTLRPQSLLFPGRR